MQKIQICKLENIEKYYKQKELVLGPVSLSIYRGEILGLRGHNGAGKSTLLKILAGVVRPNCGKYIQTKDLKGFISYVPQDIALYMSLTGWDNLFFWGRVYGLPHKAIIARSNWLLQKMDLADKAHTPLSAYSGGMQRRLHLATALMITPKLLLLDEPTVGADIHSTQIILDVLKELKSRGTAMVLVTHQVGELEKVSDRILTLDHGTIVL